MADITIDQISTQTFYQIPQIFLPSIEKKYGVDGKVIEKIKTTSIYARKLSNDAKLAYGTFYNRCLLSIHSYHQGKRDYVDENGSVFMVYTVEELMEVLDKGRMTVHKIKKELQEVGLLREVSQGANRPNRLYLQNVNANLQEFEHYKVIPNSSDKNKGKVVYEHVKTVTVTGEVLFENIEISDEKMEKAVGHPKNGRPTNTVPSTKNGRPKNGCPKSGLQGVHNTDGSKIDLSNTELLDYSSRRAEPESTPPVYHSGESYIEPRYYSLLQVIANKYNDRYFFPEGYTLTHAQKMKIGHYLSLGAVTSYEVLDMIDAIPDACTSPLAYLFQCLENLTAERRLEQKRIAHQIAQARYGLDREQCIDPLVSDSK